MVAVAWPFVAIIVAQTLLASFSLQVVSSLRAYVTGESLWSKGQREAIYYLDRYINSADPAFLQRYRQAIAVPLGDREARLALEAEPPDRSRAVEGFLKGGLHPDDIPGVIMLFENFRWFPHMADSIEAWRNAEVYLHELEKLAGSIGDPAGLTPSRRAHLLATLDRLDVQISPLAREFSDSLGEGSRVVQGLLLGANLLLAAVFIALTIWRLNSFLKHRRSIEGKLSWSANHDALTGLPNRRLFERSLRETLRSGDTQHAVIFLDLDQFKTINDTGGHAVGDHLLNGVAGELTAALPPTALLARLGGDEFGLVLPDCPHEEAQATAHRLRKIVETFDFSWEGLRYAVTASIGVVLLGDRISRSPKRSAPPTLPAISPRKKGATGFTSIRARTPSSLISPTV
ncbi:GGDEF domain-containing protein [Roseibium salinum]|uniref:GGDEF domain-containing protein n=1 Tax=Roseibium salinum TaxID=1604349 RepID=UPI003623F7B0